MAGRGDLTARLPARQIAARVRGSSVKLQGLQRQVFEVRHGDNKRLERPVWQDLLPVYGVKLPRGGRAVNSICHVRGERFTADFLGT